MRCTRSLKFKNCTLCPHCIYMFFWLRTNSDLCHLHHKLIGFYNRDEKCLPDWVFKYSSLRFVFKGLMNSTSKVNPLQA